MPIPFIQRVNRDEAIWRSHYRAQKGHIHKGREAWRIAVEENRKGKRLRRLTLIGGVSCP